MDEHMEGLDWLTDCGHNALKGMKEGMVCHTCGSGRKIVRSWSGKEQIFKNESAKMNSCLPVGQ